MAAARGGPTHPTPEGSGCLWEVAWGRWETGWKKEKVQRLDPERASELCRRWGSAWRGSGGGIRPWWGGWPRGPLGTPSSAPRPSLSATRAHEGLTVPQEPLLPARHPRSAGRLAGEGELRPCGVGLLPKGLTPTGGSVCHLPAQGSLVPRVITAAKVVLEPWAFSVGFGVSSPALISSRSISVGVLPCRA